MAINKKSMRKIVVNDDEYYYKISSSEDMYEDITLRLVLYKPITDKVRAFEFETGQKHKPFTPKDVRKVIEEKFNEK